MSVVGALCQKRFSYDVIAFIINEGHDLNTRRDKAYGRMRPKSSLIRDTQWHTGRRHPQPRFAKTRLQCTALALYLAGKRTQFVRVEFGHHHIEAQCPTKRSGDGTFLAMFGSKTYLSVKIQRHGHR
jgi:hypothetical protein